MKYCSRILSLLLVLACLIGCTGGGTDETDPAEETTAPAVSADEHKTDRILKDDFRSVTPTGEHDVRILFLNVGKADAILLKIDGSAWLIDTGDPETVPVVLGACEDLGVSHLGGIFITHTDNDHIGGLRATLAEVPTAAVYTSSISTDWDKIERLRGEVPRIALDPGEAVHLTDGVWFEVYGPIRYNPRDDNNSLVLRLRVNGATILFTGDMMFDEEKTLMSAGLDLRCDLLKVGHHGKKDATSESFVAEAGPKIAVISANKEEETESVHKSVVKLLGKAGAEVYVTENYAMGIEAVVLASGKIEISDYQTVHRGEGVVFEKVSKSDQIVVLRNTTAQEIDLAEWWIASRTGNELYEFPAGAVIPAGGTMTVACLDYSGAADYRWNEGKVWHKSKEDLAVLIDPWGNTVDTMASE
ncbi:MAG: lamin tail domain-containing protein [Clostridia bacterium]|nr:lamin tail domain-containing protein [Clostridia bacterium]